MVNFSDYFNQLFFFNPYYVIPFLFAVVILYVQWSERGNKNFLVLSTQIFGIFSFTISAEYIFIFLLTDSLPSSLSWLHKILLGIGVLITLLVIFQHTTEGTCIGTWISNILNKYFLPKAIPISISPFSEQLEKLQEIRENIMVGDKQEFNMSFQSFLEIGSSIIMTLERIYSNDNNHIKIIKNIYDSCKKEFIDLNGTIGTNPLDNMKKISIANSISEFIGNIDGFTKRI